MNLGKGGEVFVPYVKLTHKCQKLPFKGIDVSPIFKDDFERRRVGYCIRTVSYDKVDLWYIVTIVFQRGEVLNSVS